MSLIKHYTTTPQIICSFGETALEAQEKKDTIIQTLKTNGAMIIPGYDDSEKDLTLRKLKTARNGYHDIYGNKTKYFDIIYK